MGGRHLASLALIPATVLAVTQKRERELAELDDIAEPEQLPV